LAAHSPVALEVLRLFSFPEIHAQTGYFKEVLRIENPFDVSGTGHMHNTETEGMATLIPQYMRERHCSKRNEGLTEFVIGAKIG
jgi:hypothetical protein